MPIGYKPTGHFRARVPATGKHVGATPPLFTRLNRAKSRLKVLFLTQFITLIYETGMSAARRRRASGGSRGPLIPYPGIPAEGP